MSTKCRFDKYTSEKTDAETQQRQGRRKTISKDTLKKCFKINIILLANKGQTSVITAFPKNRQHNQENTRKI